MYLITVVSLICPTVDTKYPLDHKTPHLSMFRLCIYYILCYCQVKEKRLSSHTQACGFSPQIYNTKSLSYRIIILILNPQKIPSNYSIHRHNLKGFCIILSHHYITKPATIYITKLTTAMVNTYGN